MIVLKASGKIFGAKLSKAEQKAMDLEIGKQAAEFEKKHEVEFEAMTLYVLMAEYGWKEKRLKRFWDKYRKAHRDLIRRYELYDSQAPGDDAWICQKMLLENGIDITKWEREFRVTDIASEENRGGL